MPEDTMQTPLRWEVSEIWDKSGDTILFFLRPSRSSRHDSSSKFSFKQF